jgi:hypothetical protein
MKIRLGFVSNSSSSSFIVAFPSTPKNVEEVRQTLFGDLNSVSYEYDDSITFSTLEMAQAVYNDLKNQISHTPEEIAEEITYGTCYEDGSPDYDDFRDNNKSGWNIDWEAYEKAKEKFAKKVSDKFILDNIDKPVYIFEYSDNDGKFSTQMEHGDIFSALPNIRISKH